MYSEVLNVQASIASGSSRSDEGHVGTLATPLPRLKVCLNFNGDLQRLTVTVYDLEGLRAWDPNVSKCYARVSLIHHRLKVLKTKRTEAVKVDDQISYNQAFNFKVEEKAAVDDVGIKVEIVEAASLLGRGN